MSFYKDREKIYEAYCSIYESVESRMNEDNNVVHRVQGPSTSELEDVRRRALTPEERAKEDRQKARRQRERDNRINKLRYKRNETFVSAAPEEPERPVSTIGPADSFGTTQMKAAAATDPGMRIGKGVYDGIGYMAPLGMLAKGSKAAKVAKGLATGYMAGAGLEYGTKALTNTLERKNMSRYNPSIEGVSELGQWTVGLPYKATQMVSDIVSDTIDAYHADKGDVRKDDEDDGDYLTCDEVYGTGCSFSGPDSELAAHYNSVHRNKR